MIISHKKKENIIALTPHSEMTITANRMNTQTSDDKAEELVRLVLAAIEQWAKTFRLEDMPKEIVVRQAVSILDAWCKTVVRK